MCQEGAGCACGASAHALGSRGAQVEEVQVAVPLQPLDLSALAPFQALGAILCPCAGAPATAQPRLLLQVGWLTCPLWTRAVRSLSAQHLSACPRTRCSFRRPPPLGACLL